MAEARAGAQNRGMNQKLAAMAAAQGGPFHVAQARRAGYSARAIDRLVGTGEWTRLRRGVCVESRLLVPGEDAPARHALEAAAAVLALSAPGAVCSHESAAVLHGIALLRPPPTARVSLTRPPRGRGTDRLSRVRLYRAGLPAAHVRLVNGVPVTSPARTVVDLARHLPFPDAVVAADSALGTLGASRYQLREVLVTCRRWPGIHQAHDVVAAADPRSRDPLCTLARLMCGEGGLPAPKLGVRVSPLGGPSIRADLYWPEQGVIVLLDTRPADRGHLVVLPPPGDKTQARTWREQALADAGFTVIRLGWDDVVQRPGASLARIRHAIHRPYTPRPCFGHGPEPVVEEVRSA